MYLTLRALSSLDQDSVEGKEGRDEEEVTSTLLPIWNGRRETHWGKRKPDLGKAPPVTWPPPYPPHLPGFLWLNHVEEEISGAAVGGCALLAQRLLFKP